MKRCSTPSLLNVILWTLSCLTGSVIIGVEGRELLDERNGIVDHPARVVAVVQSVRRPGRSHQQTDVSYSWSGQTFTHTFGSLELMRAVQPGDSVPVTLNRNNPAQVTYDQKSLRFRGEVLILGSVGYGVVGLAPLVAVLIRRRRGRSFWNQTASIQED